MNGQRFTVIAMALAMVLSIFAGPVALVASASDHTGINANPANAGETSTHSLVEDVPTSADTEVLANVTINASNSDYSSVTASDITIGVDTNGDGAVDTDESAYVSSVATSDNGTTLTVQMDTTNTSSLADSDDVFVYVSNASNPADEGDYSVTTKVNGYDAGSHTLDIIPPLSQLDITVENRDGNAVDFATVAIDGQTVTTNSNGTASINVTAWTHTLVVSADGYDDDAREISVAEGGDSVTVTIDERGAEVANPSVEGVQIAATQTPDFVPNTFASFGVLTEEVNVVEVSEQASNGSVIVDMQGSDLTDDFSTESADGEPVDELTVEMDGEKVPVYANSTPSDIESGQKYAVYDADAQTVTAHVGDNYTSGDDVDVRVSSNDLGINEQFDVFGIDAFVPGGVPGL